MNCMVKQIHVEISISIVIKERSLRTKSLKIQTIGRSFFTKSQVTIIDVKLIFTSNAFKIAQPANVNIKQSIPIDVDHIYSCFPGAQRFQARLF